MEFIFIGFKSEKKKEREKKLKRKAKENYFLVHFIPLHYIFIIIYYYYYYNGFPHHHHHHFLKKNFSLFCFKKFLSFSLIDCDRLFKTKRNKQTTNRKKLYEKRFSLAFFTTIIHPQTYQSYYYYYFS